MNTHPILLVIIASYLLGSIPFGYLLVRLFRGSDVRTTGSGNIGATNVARTSPTLGIVTLMLDAGKGLAAVMLAQSLAPANRTLAFAAGFVAVCGHIFPIWLRFRGGKGVATGLGSFVLLTPKAILIAIGIFVVMAVAFRWIALASITATALLPLAAWLMGELFNTRTAGVVDPHNSSATSLGFLCASAALIVVKHHANIRRLLAGTEPRFGKQAR